MIEPKSNIRTQAEKIASQKPLVLDNLSLEQFQATVHELQVHQIQLEMQNDELRRLHATLDVMHMRYLALYNQAPVGYITIDENGVIIESNQTAVTMLSLNTDPDVITPLSKFIQFDDQDTFYLLRKRLFNKHENETAELVMVTSEGTSFWARLICSTATVEGKLVAPIAIEDISALKEAELIRLQFNQRLEEQVRVRTSELQESLDHIEKLQEAILIKEKIASLTPMVAAVSHELNTPIGNMSLLCSSLQERYEIINSHFPSQITSNELADFLEFIAKTNALLIKSTNTANTLVQSFKKVAVDREGSQKREFNLHDTIEDCLVMIRTSQKNSHHQIITSIPSAIELFSYPGALGQVIENLVYNAILHAFEPDQKGTITISADYTVTDTNFVLITVTDNGHGIPAENRNKIFDPFFTTKLGIGGSGLGLSIVFNLVNTVLGGSICVESTYITEANENNNPGTSFCIKIPVSTTSPAICS